MDWYLMSHTFVHFATIVKFVQKYNFCPVKWEQWSSKSPDLNLFDYRIWEILEQKVCNGVTSFYSIVMQCFVEQIGF